MHAELIAPRPLRLTSASFTHSHSTHTSTFIRPKPIVRLVSAPPTDAFAHISLADNDDDHLPDKDRPASAFDDHDPLATPRDAASPRLSPDALEEFLSILQPVVFNTPASPILRTRYERPHPYKPRAHRRARSNSVASDEGLRTPERATSRGASKSSNSDDRDELGDELVFDPRPWPYSSFLSSPISRMHTQNPLGRHVSHHEHDVPFQSAYLLRSPPSPVSPQAALVLAQSVPIPPSPPAQISPRVPSPHAMDV